MHRRTSGVEHQGKSMASVSGHAPSNLTVTATNAESVAVQPTMVLQRFSEYNGLLEKRV